ncbi:MAG: ABC transporter ATP-binding protein [Oscillospiraceae bacterium]|nr:ABC transporter ATP-binding protein [Oscillospiraceae bacterium]
MDERKYTGINKRLKSEFLQTILDKLADGTFSEFIDDWKWIFQFSKRYKWIVVFYTFLGIFSSTFALGSSYVSRILINIIVEKRMEKLWLLITLMLLSTVLSLAFSSVMSRVSTKISIYVNNDIQAEIFDKIIDARWDELNKYQNGDLLNRFNADVGTISSNAISWIPNLVINIYTFAVTFIVLMRMDATMAWIAILSAPFLLVMSHYIMRKLKMYRKRVLEMNSQMMSFEMETFYNIDSIKSFGILKHYSKLLRGWQQKYKEYNLDYNKFEIKTNILMTIVSTIVGMTAFGYCLFRLWTGAILYGDMTFFMQQRSNLSSKFSALVATVPGMLNSAISAHRIRELVDLPKEDHDPEKLAELREVAKDGITLSLDDVTFGYTEDKTVYENTSFVARPNEIVAVLGESGGGKTTMFRLILGLIRPDSGTMSLQTADGRSVEMNADLRQLISYVPQGNSMIYGTVAENMRMVREDATDEEIIQCLKMACAWGFVKRLPEGINTRVGERGKGVSEGQAQRLSIARAMLRDSPILLLDEATSALDEETEDKVLDNIIKYCPNKTCIVATHRPSVLKRCHRIYKITEKSIRTMDYSEAERELEQTAANPEQKG